MKRQQEVSAEAVRAMLDRAKAEETAEAARLARQAKDAAEARKLRKALRDLSDAVLLHLHALDTTVGMDKSIPRNVSAQLGRVATQLDVANDVARRFALDASITADGKAKAVQKLLVEKR
jgi:hypothetical protein